MKQNLKILGWILLAVALILVIGAMGGFKLPFSLQPLATVPLSTNLGQCLGGWTTFSIDRVDVVGTGNRIRIYGVAKGSECMQIAFTQEQLDSYFNSKGYDATKPIFGSIKLLEYTKTFPFDKRLNNDESEATFKNIGTNVVIPNTKTAVANIENCIKYGSAQGINSNNVIFAYKAPGAFLGIFTDMRCVTKSDNGISGNFAGGRSYGDFKVLFDVNGQQATLTRSQQTASLGSSSIDLAGGKAKIEWTGNLNNLDEITVPQYEGRLYESRWKLIDQGSYNSVQTAYNNFISCMTKKLSAYGGTYMYDSDFDLCKTKWNTEISSSTYLTDRIGTYELNNANLIYDANTDSGNLYVALKASPFPTFILDLDAVWVGIVPLAGKPVITQCITPQTSNSGSTKVVNFGIKNDANVNAEFIGSISCSTGTQGFIPNFQIGAGQTLTKTTELISSNPNTQDLISSCTLKISDLKSTSSVSCSFTNTVKYVSGITCSSESLSCEGNNIMRCGSDGKSKTTEKSCPNGCEYVSGGVRCKGETNITQVTPPCTSCDSFVQSQIFGSFWKSKKCQRGVLYNSLTCSFSYIKYAVIALVFLFGLLFGQGFFSQFKNIPSWASWLIALIVALILGWLVYFSFWLGVIIFIIYIIVRVILGGVSGAFRR